MLHGWSAVSILREGEKVLVPPEEQIGDEEEVTDLDREQIRQTFGKLVKNQTKTPKQFKVKIAELFGLAHKWKNPRAKSFIAYLNQIKDNKLKWVRYALAWDTDEFYNN